MNEISNITCRNSSFYVSGIFKGQTIFDSDTITTDSTFSNTYIACYSIPQSISNIEENFSEEQNFSISPNPAKDFIDIKINNVIDFTENVEIYDIFGRMIQKGNVFTDRQKIRVDVSTLVSGLYFLKANIGNQIIMRKFLVAR